ncbi:MAG: WD40 repeat domain-containing protein [Kofleriaceae bacterium]
MVGTLTDTLSPSAFGSCSGAAKGTPLKGHTWGVTAVAFTGDGRLVTGSRDNTLCVWDLERGGKPLVRMEGHEREIVAIAVSPDGTRVLSCADGDRVGRVRAWDVKTGRELGRFDPHHGDAFRLSFSTDGRCGYSISRDDRAVAILDGDAFQ